MLLALDPDQELFRETTEKLLDELAPVSELRRLRHDPDGFDQEYWRRGADLGWTSLLVSEELGGGSICRASPEAPRKWPATSSASACSECRGSVHWTGTFRSATSPGVPPAPDS
jgi:alkylation response protein AidB-like acyl-CoA dehydrogenase